MSGALQPWALIHILNAIQPSAGWITLTSLPVNLPENLAKTTTRLNLKNTT